MPSYIADDKEEHFAQLSGTFSTDEANKVTTFGADGQANTGYTLPSASSWLLVEVFNVEGTAGDVGYHKWTNKVNQIASDLVKYRSIATAEYTTYDITVTHYKGNNTADVYRGDESTALSLASIDTGIAWTPPTTWIISDVIVAPDGFVYGSIETLINPYYDGSHLARFTFNDEPTNLVTGEDAIIYGTGGSYVDSQGLTRAYEITTPALTDYVETDVTLPTGAWSISCFLTLNANTVVGTTQSDGNAIIGSGALTTSDYFYIFSDDTNSKVTVVLGEDASNYLTFEFSNTVLSDGQRHHFVLTHDGSAGTGSFTGILDGSYVTSTADTETGTYTGATQAEALRIGQMLRSDTNKYATLKGAVDQVDIFNKVLTLEEARWIGTTYTTEYNLHAPTITTATGGVGNTATDDDISKGTFHVETATGQTYFPYLRFVNTDAVLGKKYDAELIVTITSGTAEFRYIEAQPFDLPWRASDQDQILTTGTYKFYGIVSYDYNFATEPRMSVLFDGNTTYTSWDGTAELKLTEHMEQPYLIELNIDNTKVSGAVDLVDFPVFLTEANFADTIDFFKHIRSDAGDIRFYADEECYKPIAFEIASIDKDKELIEIYVKIPLIDYNADTKFYMRYGNPLVQPLAVDAPFGRNAVWSDFDRVFHFADDPSLGTLTDSSGNQDGVAAGTWTSNDLVKANGKSAWEWDGSTDQYVNLGTDAQFVWDDATQKYISFYGTLNTTGTRHAFLGQYNGTDSTANAEFYGWWYNGAIYFMFGSNYNGITGYTASGTYEIVYNARKDASTIALSTTTTDTVSITNNSNGSNTQDVLLGASWTDNTSTARERWWDGTVGEVRISLSNGFTDAWYETERENLLNPSTFTTATQITDISRWNYITNPSFGVNSDWTLGTNWSIAVTTGRLYSSGSNTNAEAVIGIDSNTNNNALAVGDLVDIYVDVDTISGTLTIATHDNTGGDTVMLHSNTTTVGLHHKRHFIQATDEEFSLYSNTYTGYIKETGVFKVDGYLLGDEECDNGTFDANITGWTNQGSGSIQWDSGNQRLQVNGTTAYDGARYTKNLKNYTWYRVQFRIVDGTYTGQYYVKLDSGEGISNIDGKDAIRTVALKTGSTASTNGFLDIQQITTSTGTWFIDDVSIEEIIEPNKALQEIYVNFISNSLDGTSDVVMNTLGYLDFRPTALVDRYGNPTDVEISLTTTQTLWYDATWGYNEGSDGYALPDEMMLSTAYDTQCPLDGRWAYTITGLDNRKTYSIEVMPSRGTGTFTYPNTVYRISGHADQTVNIDNNMMDTAIFTGVSPIAGQVQLELAPDVDDGSIAINGIIIKEEIPTIIDTEMHSDPEFRSTSGWSGTGSGFTPNGNGTLSVAASPTVNAYRAIGGAPYTLYKISVTCGAVTTAGRLNVGVGGYNSSWVYFETEDTTRDLYFVASHPSSNANFYFGYYQTTFVGDLTHLSIKPVTKGLKLGPNIVKNPNFNDTSAWSLPTGVSITGGVLSVTSTATGISVGELTDDVEAGATYKVTVVVSAYTAGDYNVRLGEIGFVYGTDLSSQTTKVRTHEYYYYTTYKNTNTVEIHHTETPTYSIESISVQKVLEHGDIVDSQPSYGAELFPDPNFVDGTGLTLGGGTTVSNGMTLTAASTDTVTNSALVATGQIVRVIINVSTVTTAGLIRIGIGQYQYQHLYIDSVGEYKLDIRTDYSSQTGKMTIGDGSFAGVLSSCSLKPLLRGELLGPNVLKNYMFDNDSAWELSTGWSINTSTGALVCTTGAGTNNVKGDLSVSPAIGEIYKVTVSVSAYTSGNFQVQLGNAGSTYWLYPSGVDTYVCYITETTADTDVFKITPATSAFSINYISVQKVLDAPPTPKSGAVYGDEVVVTADRTFATSTGWTLNGSATISGGVLDIPVGTSHSAQTTVGETGLIDDSTYRVWYNVSNVVTAGVIRIGLGGYHNSTVRVTTVGWQYTDIRVDSNLQNGKVVVAGNTADVQITEISVKRLISGEQLSAQILNDPDFDSGTTNWTFGTGWTSNTGYAAASSASGNLTNDVDFGDEYGTIYKVVFKLSSYTTGRMYADIGQGWGVYLETDDYDNPLDEHVCYIKRAAIVDSAFKLVGVDSATLNVDYVKVYKVLS